MKKEQFFEILSDLDEEEIERAGSYALEEGAAATEEKRKEEGAHIDHPSKPRRVWTGFGSAVAVMAVMLLGIWLLWPKGTGSVEQKEKYGGAPMGIDQTNPDLTESAKGSSTELEKGGRVSNPRDWTEEDAAWMKSVKVIDASLPEPIAAGMSAEEYYYSEEYVRGIRAANGDYRTVAFQLMDSMQGFYGSIAKSMLARGEDNVICSPLNIYLALSLLSETTDGNSRKQLLDFLGVDDIETLRGNVDALWNSNFVDTPLVQSYLANSLWLNESVPYETDTLERLAKNYHASSFIGKPGSKDMDQGLKSWTNKATGGLLEKYVQSMHIAPETVLELVSTIYYHAMWTDKFTEAMTTKETFHGTKGATTVSMMHRSQWMNVYRSEKVTALRLALENGGNMYFYLPAEGVDIAELAADPELESIEYLRAKRAKEWNEHYAEWKNSGLSDEEIVHRQIEAEREAGWIMPMVHMSIPRFHVDQKTDLLRMLSENGITDIINSATSDFSPLTKAASNIYVSKADHAATLEIDEKGVKGAAYVEIVMEGATLTQPEEEIDFVLDRPFLFAVYSGDGSILFQGIVRNIG